MIILRFSLLIALFACLATNVPPKLSDHMLNMVKLSEEIKLSEHILAITLKENENIAAYLSVNHFSVFRIGKSGIDMNMNLLYNISLGTNGGQTDPLYFQLLKGNQAIICYTSSCQVAIFNKQNYQPLWKTYNFSKIRSTLRSANLALSDTVKATEVTALLSSTRDDNGTINDKQQMLNVGIVVGSKMGRIVLMRYDTERVVSQASTDRSFFEKTRLVLSFESNGYMYFVSNVERYIPGRSKRLSSQKDTIIRISRICTKDETDLLESRIDLTLTCDIQSKNTSLGDGIFERENDRLIIVSQQYFDVNEITNSERATVICQFPMALLRARFNSVWDLCQKTNYSDAENKCEHLRGPDLRPAYCFIYTHAVDVSKPCSRYNAIPSFPTEIFENCQLHTAQSTANRFGFLEDFRPINGSILAVIENGQGRPLRLSLAGRHIAFLLYENGLLIRVPFYGEQKLRTELLWNLSLPSSKGQAFVSTKDRLVYIKDKMIKSIGLTCEELFRSCEQTMSVRGHEPLHCGWCTLLNGSGFSLSVGQKAQCPEQATFLKDICPPRIEYMVPRNRTDDYVLIEIHGKRLTSLSKMKVTVCQEECKPRSISDDKLTCLLKRETTSNDVSCLVEMSGEVAEKQMRVQMKTDILLGSGQEGILSRIWPLLLSILTLFIFGLVIACSVSLLFRRRQRRVDKKSAIDDQSSSSTLSPFQMGQNHNGAFLIPTVTRNGVNMYRAVNGDCYQLNEFSPYETLINDVDPKLRISLDKIRFDTEIGRGHFGVVNKATYGAGSESERKVACKMLQGGMNGVREFLKEGLIMEQFRHPRVMPLIGIAFTADFYPIIVTEFMANGDLLSYLRNREMTPTLRQLLNFGLQIAEGMQYLYKSKFIHRDLAARNCMLDGQLQIKIADFGLCRAVSKYESYEPVHKNRDLPLRWMSIEALQREEFTFKGDVWSYGVVLWELMTRGMVPYAGMHGMAILDFLSKGSRLQQPQYCPSQLYDNVMCRCWADRPEDRPTFDDLCRQVPQVTRSLERSEQLNAHYEPVSFPGTNHLPSTSTLSAQSTLSSI